VGDMLGFPKSVFVNYTVRKRRGRVPAWQIDGAVRLKAALSQGRSLELHPVPIQAHSVAFLQYTGGTTGVAKAAMLTHANICANILQAAAWLAPVFGPAAATLIAPLPLFHIFALTGNGLLFFWLGWRNILIPNPRDTQSIVAALQRYPVAFITGVNTLFNTLLNTPEFSRVDFSHLRMTIGGGMAVQAAVAKRWKEVTGNNLTQAWGLTETSPVACINPPREDYNGSIGLPVPSTRIAIKDEDGQDLPPGELGELCVQGPQVTPGYWHRPEETEQVLLPGGWLRTGDIGRIDAHGYVFIEDRKKDMILVSGFNVYPNEVEQVAANHPGVLEVAAVAQPDAHSGEVVALFVVRKNPALTARSITDFCRLSLASYKTPRHVYFRDELPRSAVGKILRKDLREEVRNRVAVLVRN
jgi:long-chain acyl-CoA synthetase